MTDGLDEVPDKVLSEVEMRGLLTDREEIQEHVAELRVSIDVLSEMERLTTELLSEEITYREFMDEMTALRESDANKFLRE